MPPRLRQRLALRALDELTFSPAARTYPGDHEKGDELWKAIPEKKRDEILEYHNLRLGARDVEGLFTNGQIRRIFALRRELEKYLRGSKH